MSPMPAATPAPWSRRCTGSIRRRSAPISSAPASSSTASRTSSATRRTIIASWSSIPRSAATPTASSTDSAGRPGKGFVHHTGEWANRGNQMKRFVAIGLALLLMGQAPPPRDVSALAWMSGDWLSEEGGTWTEEHWSAPRAGAMIGYSRSGRGATMREYEYIRIEAGADGALAYVALP